MVIPLGGQVYRRILIFQKKTSISDLLSTLGKYFSRWSSLWVNKNITASDKHNPLGEGGFKENRKIHTGKLELRVRD
jgi:hypothetical protein